MLSKVREKPGEHLSVLVILWKSIPFCGVEAGGAFIWVKGLLWRCFLVTQVEPALLSFPRLCLLTLPLVLWLLRRQDVTSSLEQSLTQLFFTGKCSRALQSPA